MFVSSPRSSDPWGARRAGQLPKTDVLFPSETPCRNQRRPHLSDFGEKAYRSGVGLEGSGTSLTILHHSEPPPFLLLPSLFPSSENTEHVRDMSGTRIAAGATDLRGFQRKSLIFCPSGPKWRGRPGQRNVPGVRDNCPGYPGQLSKEVDSEVFLIRNRLRSPETLRPRFLASRIPV